MFEGLRGAIEELDVPAHADAIVELRALRDRLDARLTIAEAAYAKEHGYHCDGFGSMASFLRHRSRMATGDARRASTRAGRVAAWPEVGAAWDSGTLTGAQVDVVAATIPDRHVERFAATAAETSTIISPLDLTDTKRALEHWVEFADSCAEREAAEDGREPPVDDVTREGFLSRTSGDVAVLKGELDRDAAAITEHALRLATRRDPEGARRSPARRRADALVAIARFYADHHTELSSNRRQERLVIDCPILALYGSALRGAGVRTAEQLEAFLAARPARRRPDRRRPALVRVRGRGPRAAPHRRQPGDRPRAQPPGPQRQPVACPRRPGRRGAGTRAAPTGSTGSTPTTSSGGRPAGPPTPTTPCSCRRTATRSSTDRGGPSGSNPTAPTWSPPRGATSSGARRRSPARLGSRSTPPPNRPDRCRSIRPRRARQISRRSLPRTPGPRRTPASIGSWPWWAQRPARAPAVRRPTDRHRPISSSTDGSSRYPDRALGDLPGGDDHGADRFRRGDRELDRATGVASDSLNGGNQRTADGEFALAA